VELVIRVLQMWKTDYLGGGGGAIAMNRLHIGLKAAGIDSKILCIRKTTDSPDSIRYSPNRFIEKIENGLKRSTANLGLHDIHRLNSFLIRFHPAYRKADVIHIHGTHGFLNYLALPLLSMSKPVVYTLHDMWPYTGHCGFSYDCERWKTGCGKCLYPENHPAIQKDHTRIEWKLKDWVYRLSDLRIVTLSTMKTQEASWSILNRFSLYHIPNGLDIEIYYPLDSEQCRRQLGLPLNKRVLMFAALSLDQPRKGSDLLIKALQNLPESLKSDTILVTIGHGDRLIGEKAGIPIVNLGFIHDDRQKAVVYSAADIFVSPSRGETLPLVLQEAAACGTPLVSFDVGGVADILHHGITGYLAQPENAEDLCKGIITLLEDARLRNQMSRHARNVILKEFTLEKQVQRYIKLYQDCL
jgi:glycosyltransferase involved in cell wall biosynthesis